MREIKITLVSPHTALFAIVMSIVMFTVLFWSGVNWAIALPWALFAVAALKLEVRQ